MVELKCIANGEILVYSKKRRHLDVWLHNVNWWHEYVYLYCYVSIVKYGDARC